MEYIKSYEVYNEELIIEKLNLKPLLQKFKITPNNKKIATLIAASLLSMLTATQAINFIENTTTLDDTNKKELVEVISNYKDPVNFSLSKSGLDHIKNYEKLKLDAYKLGDGMITIGYGHAEPIKTSKYKIGNRITEKEANELLRKDLEFSINGVKRIFKQWKNDGINIKLTQNQFDVMVSLSFNMGLTGLRTSKFIRALKQNQIDKAAELLKTTAISEDFPGLAVRRSLEYEIFIAPN